MAEGTNLNVPDLGEMEHADPDREGMSSELVVLIRAGDEILGGITLDSMEPAAFSEQDMEAVGSLADKLAEQLMAEKR